MSYRIPEAAKPYRPSSGSEGEMFRAAFCDRCVHDVNSDCGILLRTLVHLPDDEEYPKEWTHDAEGEPTCTKFEAVSSPF
jgi:hypothetical protein